jgi:hypothetical protein
VAETKVPDWLTYFLDDLTKGEEAIRLLAGAVLGFTVTFFCNRLSVPLGIYVLLNMPSIAMWYIGYASVHGAAMLAVLGSGFGGFAFGVGWLLGILACGIFWLTRKKPSLNLPTPPPGTT